jgi:hypothetical protein
MSEILANPSIGYYGKPLPPSHPPPPLPFAHLHHSVDHHRVNPYYRVPSLGHPSSDRTPRGDRLRRDGHTRAEGVSTRGRIGGNEVSRRCSNCGKTRYISCFGASRPLLIFSHTDTDAAPRLPTTVIAKPSPTPTPPLNIDSTLLPPTQPLPTTTSPIDPSPVPLATLKSGMFFRSLSGKTASLLTNPLS